MDVFDAYSPSPTTADDDKLVHKAWIHVRQRGRLLRLPLNGISLAPITACDASRVTPPTSDSRVAHDPLNASRPRVSQKTPLETSHLSCPAAPPRAA